MENKWIPRILFYSPRCVFSRDIRGRDPSYIFICRSVISLGKIRQVGHSKWKEIRRAAKGRRQRGEEKKIEARKISSERNRVCMTLEREYGCTTLWLRVGPIPRESESISPPNCWGKVSEENGGGEKRTENEIGGGNKNTLCHRNKQTYFLAAAYPRTNKVAALEF